MPDDRTQQTLDTLADLFLTGTGFEATPGRSDGADHAAPPPANAPFKLPPKLDPGPTLVLHRDDDPTPPAVPIHLANEPPAPARSQPAALVHVALLGNLPGFAGPWLTQYAQQLAQDRGPVAVLHADGPQIDVELVEPRDTPTHASAAHASPLADLPVHTMSLSSLLDTLLTDAEAPVRTVLLRLPDDPHPDHVAATAAELRRFPRWTLLTGADDAAVVAAYSKLKALAEADDACAACHVDLLVCGTDRDGAERAAARVAAAADAYLDTPVRLAGHLARMRPAQVTPLASFDRDADTCDWDTAAQRLASLPLPQSVEHAETPAPRPTRVPPAGPNAGPIAGPQTTHTPPDGDDPMTHAAFTPRRAADPTPQPQLAAQTDTPPAAAELLTAQDAPLAGAVTLDARCPEHPAVDLILDGQGRLHLAARPDQIDNQDALSKAMIDLMETRRWVEKHAQLLALTQRQLKLDTAAEPTLHLFTARADWATGLVARLGNALKLHLLARVHVGQQSTWFTTPLN